jgi:nicotinate-nucleotide adenylyltransferase
MEEVSRWIFFGGGFNPPHLGHFEKARAILDRIPDSVIIFLPTYNNPWSKPLEKFGHRTNMILYSLDDLDPVIGKHLPARMFISLFEHVYCEALKATVDVVKLLKRRFPDADPDRMSYLIGHDQADLMDKWSRWEELIELIPFIVVSRGGYEENKMDWYRKEPHLFLNAPVEHDSLSSTQIREQLKQERFSPYVTTSTLNYIRRNNLYV